MWKSKNYVSFQMEQPVNRNLLSREQKKQRLLALMRKASQTQKKRLKRQQAWKLHSAEIQKLNNVYTKGKAAFGSVANIKEESGLSHKKIEQFLQSKNSYTKYRQFQKTFPRLKVVAYRINEIWSMDVAYMDKIANQNNGFQNLLVAVGVLSLYFRVQPLRTMYSKDWVEAFYQMIKTKQPEKVWTDKGTQFKGEFKTFCENKKIHLFTTENETESAFAERNIRSLKNIIYRYFEEKWTWNYIKKLLSFVNIIKSRVNRVTKLATNKVFKKHDPFLISIALDNNKYKPRFEERDLVRIAEPDDTFRKGYTQNYKEEVITVLRLATTSPPMYNLIDANNVKILGKFYEPELVQVDVLNTEGEQWFLTAMSLNGLVIKCINGHFQWKYYGIISEPFITTDTLTGRMASSIDISIFSIKHQ